MTAGRPLYLDHAATTPPAPEVLEVMFRCLRETTGNPSSVHACGRAARAAVDEARDRVAAVLGCSHGEVVWTSGGTETANLALRGVTDRLRDRGRHIVISAIEHGVRDAMGVGQPAGALPQSPALGVDDQDGPAVLEHAGGEPFRGRGLACAGDPEQGDVVA